MEWFRKVKPGIASQEKKNIPEGLWTKCPTCAAVLYRPELDRNINVCPKCSHHMRIGARERRREPRTVDIGSPGDGTRP